MYWSDHTFLQWELRWNVKWPYRILIMYISSYIISYIPTYITSKLAYFIFLILVPSFIIFMPTHHIFPISIDPPPPASYYSPFLTHDFITSATWSSIMFLQALFSPAIFICYCHKLYAQKKHWKYKVAHFKIALLFTYSRRWMPVPSISDIPRHVRESTLLRTRILPLLSNCWLWLNVDLKLGEWVLLW